jgi:hypothetical protein
MKYQYVNYYLDQNILPKYKMNGSTINISEPPATAGNARVNASSLLSKSSKITQGGYTVTSVSVVFIMLVIQLPFTSLGKDEATNTPGDNSLLSINPALLEVVGILTTFSVVACYVSLP